MKLLAGMFTCVVLVAYAASRKDERNRATTARHDFGRHHAFFFVVDRVLRRSVPDDDRHTFCQRDGVLLEKCHIFVIDDLIGRTLRCSAMKASVSLQRARQGTVSSKEVQFSLSSAENRVDAATSGVQ